MNIPSAPDLFGNESAECELEDGPAAGFVTDEWGSAWLCSSHLKRFQIQSLSVGRTLAHYLREPKA